MLLQNVLFYYKKLAITFKYEIYHCLYFNIEAIDLKTSNLFPRLMKEKRSFFSAENYFILSSIIIMHSGIYCKLLSFIILLYSYHKFIEFAQLIAKRFNPKDAPFQFLLLFKTPRALF